MYKIIKILENDLDVFIVVNSIKKQEVARFNTYAEASKYIMSK
jgi:hypothetical protein